jgi:3-oxoacyl-[acyl-carrier protein] reductase
MIRRVLVTGASRGIGRAIAVRLARGGFNVTVHYRHQHAPAKAVAAEITAAGGAASLMAFDVADRNAAAAALLADVEANGAFYGVVCNAGIHRDNAFPALTEEDWDTVIDTNLNGFFNVMHPLTMPMVRLRKGGRVVVLSSVAGMMGNRGQVNYSAAKAGLIGAAKALAVELARRNITVNCVAPGVIETDMTSDVDMSRLADAIPMRRMGSAAEVAALVGFLFSSEAGYITRQVIAVNGGMF